MIALAWLLACGGGAPTEAVDLAPVDIGLAECAVCGMVVGEQPSPRGQLVYRDGAHAHVCSLEEARALAQVPDARGRPAAVYVEALPADFDWSATDTAPLPWTEAEAAHFVYGAPRRMVMGTPLLSYADPAAAEEAARALGSHPVGWAELLDTPVPVIPASAGWHPPATRRSP